VKEAGAGTSQAKSERGRSRHVAAAQEPRGDAMRQLEAFSAQPVKLAEACAPDDS